MNDPIRTASEDRIPVMLLTGFLGSGKTTLLNHIVQQPEFATALVIINEFGEMPLDHALVTHSTEQLVMEMSNGCMCCTIRGDLINTLNNITWRFGRNGIRQFDRVLIETTGLADPVSIIHTLMTNADIVSTYRLDGVVATLDLATGLNSLDLYTEAVRQMAMADCILLTKADLATPETRQQLSKRLDSINPAAPRWEVNQGQIDATALLNLEAFPEQGRLSDIERWLKEEAYTAKKPSIKSFRPIGNQTPSRHNFLTTAQHIPQDINRHDDHIRAFCFSVEDPIPERLLVLWIDSMMQFMGSNILRVKAILNVEGHDAPLVVHGVQHIFHPPISLPGWPNEDRRSRLVFITRDIGKEIIEESFEVFRKLRLNIGEKPYSSPPNN